MSDVLLYAAITENQKLIRAFVESKVNPGAPQDIEYYATPAIADSYNNFNRPLSQCPAMVQSWRKFLTPFAAPRANGLKVCDTSGNFRCGASCLWTVPAGVTQAQFQLWGHGGGNSGQCCCGGAPFGPSGAYMVANVPVTPGETFCLVSGCAFCCYASQTTPGLGVENTGVCSVTTPNVALCANGASTHYAQWLSMSVPGQSISQCGPLGNDGCNPSSCSGWNFCWDSGSDNLCTPQMFSKATIWATACAVRPGVTAYGLPGVFPAIFIGPDLTAGSFTIAGPVFGFENCTCCQNLLASNSCGGCLQSAQNGFQQIPGVGGYGLFRCAGVGGDPGGDAGGMGMVCVSWN